ncbi:hypothetical protein H6F42_14090 [Pseudanabaena sp. FACHB-1998]|uniref:hypothetical protein n=1 Tax=Pseudanabaena sp. FACHB-1998 TaxID=2692858 RepID=UPI00168086A7|nr:hypothetical protein [Pseudanabaena sp. FACHB-1998]MBD2178047.1 hypothetical protein [Pseudanabaena sp. FACHB-1998]
MSNTIQDKIVSSILLTTALSMNIALSSFNSSGALANPIKDEYGNLKNTSIKAVVIPQNQLPPALEKSVVFREISSGGITGATYQTLLLKDGTLIRIRIGDSNDSSRSVRKVSLDRVKQFEKLLHKNAIAKFKNLSYPAPRGAADYITYTLTSKEGTFQYNDISQNGLPKNLQYVVSAWKQIKI